jgi:peroxiredoxin
MGKLLEPGALVPNLSLDCLDGGQASLRTSEPVVLVFFKISCPVCQLTLPYLERLHPQRKIWGVSQNTAEDTREFAAEFELTFPMLLDPEDRFPASNAFGITHVPTLFLLDAQGRLEKVIEGWSKQEMEALGAIRAGDNVPAWKAG